MHELIIIGGGPAAISASIYAARKKIKTVLIAKEIGGQVTRTASIENYPGFGSISGPDLVKKLFNHLESLINNEFEIKKGTEVKKIKQENSLLEVETDDGSYQAKTVLIVTGAHPKKLSIPGEDEFSGKGVSYCSTCDAPIFKDKEVAVVGGGNAGLEASIDLSKYASKIYLFEYMDKLSGDEYLQEKVNQDSKVNVITKARIKRIKGSKFVEILVYSDNGQNKEIQVQGIFIEIGSNPNSAFVKNMVELNELGEIKIDSKNRTSVENIFAAGDVTDISHKQIVIATGQGAKAVLNAYDYLRKMKGK